MTPLDNKRPREPSPLATISKDMQDNLPLIPTGPRADMHKGMDKRARYQGKMAPLLPVTPSSEPATSLTKEPVQTRGKNESGTRPVGFFVGPTPPPAGTIPTYDTTFPVQRVKYLEDNGKLLKTAPKSPIYLDIDNL
jgi:hypothetical protein